METQDYIVLGAGLAGSEAALTLAEAGKRVLLYEQKPKHFSPAHKLSGAAELVCSNSLKSLQLSAAHGLMKEELRLLDSPLLKLAKESSLPGGQALVVDREVFSKKVTETLKAHPLIEYREEEVKELPSNGPCLIATGPLTGHALMKSIQKLLQDKGLYFYDATCPVVSLESLDMNYFFWGSREGSEDYLNLPLNEKDYFNFRNKLLAAQKVEAHLPEEELKYFEGCLPIEVLAERGELTLAYSCMKPIGFELKDGSRPFAVIQFRREKAAGELLSLVGFQTRMKWGDQTEVLRSLPGMKDAEFVRLGAMHRNSFINTPLYLNESLQLKLDPRYYFAGQITGSEGYTEALSTGHFAALQMLGYPPLPSTSAIGALVHFLLKSDPKYFQPMNFNFGLLPTPSRDKLKGRGFHKKAHKKELQVKGALEALNGWLENVAYKPKSSTLQTN